MTFRKKRPVTIFGNIQQAHLSHASNANKVVLKKSFYKEINDYQKY